MHIEYNLWVNADRETIWEMLTQMEKIKLWSEVVVGGRRISPGDLTSGFLSCLHLKEESWIAEYECKILDFQENSMLGISLLGEPLGENPLIMNFRLVPERTRTLLKYDSYWVPEGLGLVLMAPIMTVLSRKNIIREMGSLKHVAESRVSLAAA